MGKRVPKLSDILGTKSIFISPSSRPYPATLSAAADFS